VFRVTAEALRIAQGDVRCGVCSTTFNALENLSEQAFKASAEDEAPAPDDSMTVEELPGGENIELSGPVELTVVPDGPLAEAPPQDVEPEPPREGDPDDEQRAMEFHGDAADLDRLFVVQSAAVERFAPAATAEAQAAPNPVIDLDSTDEHPILVLDERDEAPEEPAVEAIVLETAEPKAALIPALPSAPDPSPAPATPKPVPPGAPRPAASAHTAPRILIPDEMRKRLAAEAEARAAAAAIFEPEQDGSEPFLSRRWPWAAGVAVLALLLVLQVLHSERHDLVRSPTLGSAVARAYAFFGMSVATPTDLAAYELRQWGAASDPNEANRLMLRASIVNRATYSQPLPLLRLSLQDRFGGTLHLRDIAPPDYLPGAGGEGLLGPGERADALIRIVDPGPEVVGFELDICLPAGGGVRCANPIKTARS
jgi:predicted Zn finger-like uncharacterized protein